MVKEANDYIARGAYGIDLLGYRYTGDAVHLNKEFVASVKAPVCIAGSINSYQRLDEIKVAAPWAFTIGGAFFENKFGGTFEEKINRVCEYMRE
jgi:phosphoribosylformimino-5-aminoimidazole carboxamide ribonucleotide (ProFAR) isomerase